MDINIRLKVTADLCCDCIRNSAYYHAGWSSPNQLKKEESDFWVNLNGNFLDIAVLSWCHLFGDSRAEFRWQKLVDNKDEFCKALCESLVITEEEYENYITSMREYRDKMVAHRDRYLAPGPMIHYPGLNLAVKSAAYLYSELRRSYSNFSEIYQHKDLNSFYQSRLNHALREYNTAMN